MTPPDFSLTLVVDNGSVPPRHRKSSRTTLRADGTLRVTRKQGYKGDGVTTEQTLDPTVLSGLVRDLRRLGLFTTIWTEREHRTVGGGQWHLRVTAGDEQAEIPSMLHPDHREMRDQIRDCVNRVVRVDHKPADSRPPAPPGRQAW